MATLTVNAGGNLQTAFNNAQSGDTIVLEAGASFSGNFVLPVKTGSSYITVKSSATLPQRRITPADVSLLPRIFTGSTSPTLDAGATAAYWRFEGIEFYTAVWLQNVIRLGTTDSTNAAHHFVFDRCYIHANPATGARRGIAGNVRYLTVKNSYFEEFKLGGSDSQTICGWNTPGDWLVENNYLSAASENIMIGGSPNFVGIATNIIIRGNHMFKPLAWKTQGVLVKNLIELKHGINVTVEGNVFENMWSSAQAIAWNIKVDIPGGIAPVTKDVTFKNNIVKNAEAGVFTISRSQGTDPNSLLDNITLENNYCYNSNSRNIFSGTSGVTLGTITLRNNIIEQGTSLAGPSLVIDNTCDILQLNMYGNRFPFYTFGFHNGGVGTITSFVRSWDFSDNYFYNAPSIPTYPSGVEATALGLNALASTVDWNAIDNATRYAVSGDTFITAEVDTVAFSADITFATGDLMSLSDEIASDFVDTGTGISALNRPFSDDLGNLTDNLALSLVPAVPGHVVPSVTAGMTRDEIVQNLMLDLGSGGYYLPEDFNEALQDGYSEVAAFSGSILKTVEIFLQADIVYYDILALVPDYIGAVGIWNPQTKQWLVPVSYREFDNLRPDWETTRRSSGPWLFCPVNYRYIAFHPAVQTSSGSLHFHYRAAAEIMNASSIPELPQELAEEILRIYTTCDLYEQQYEWKKAGLQFRKYIEKVEELKRFLKKRDAERFKRLGGGI